MLTAVVDTNVFVSGILSDDPNSSNSNVLESIFAKRFILALSPSVLSEIEAVLALPQFQVVHGRDDDDIRQFCLNLAILGRMVPEAQTISPAIVRDVTDTKLITLALDADADCLVTNDRRHLLRLKAVGRTKIITPFEFVKILKSHS